MRGNFRVLPGFAVFSQSPAEVARKTLFFGIFWALGKPCSWYKVGRTLFTPSGV